ncbi:MAG: hypothetical protein ACI81R_001956 [Bradymonadia bacterium]|jgi:hypothetical protein
MLAILIRSFVAFAALCVADVAGAQHPPSSSPGPLPIAQLELRCGDARTSIPAPPHAREATAHAEPLGATSTGEWCVATVALEGDFEWRALLHEGHDDLVVEARTLGRSDVVPTYALTDLDQDGAPELLAVAGVDNCGLPSAFLEPRVYSASDGRLRPVTLRPSIDHIAQAATEPARALPAPQWMLPFTFASHTSSGLPGGGADDALGTAEADDQAWRPLSDLDGVGAWTSMRVPAVHTASAVDLRVATGTAPQTLLISTHGWLRQLQVADELVRVTLPPGANCVTIQIAEGHAFGNAAVDVARVITTASQQTDWIRDWALPALRDACQNSPIHVSRVTRGLFNQTSDFTGIFNASTTSSDCVKDAVVDLLVSAPANDARRLEWLLSTHTPRHRQTLLQSTEMDSADWLQALLTANETDRAFIAQIAHDDALASEAAHTIWPPTAGIPAEADRLLDGIILDALLEITLPADTTDARRILSIVARASPAAPSPDWLAPLLRDAIAHSDGTVARLALVATERHAVAALEDDVRAVLRDDPLPLLRVAALSAWLSLTTENPQPLIAELATSDPSPSVRLAAAARWEAPASTLVDAGLAETWPEVQLVFAERTVDEADAQAVPLLLALLAQGTRLPLPATCPSTAWAPLLDEVQPSARGFRQLVHYLAECPDDGWPERLVEAAELAPEQSRAFWLMAVTGTPLALPLARLWLGSRELEPALLSADVLWVEGTDSDRARVLVRAADSDEPGVRAAWELLLGGG